MHCCSRIISMVFLSLNFVCVSSNDVAIEKQDDFYNEKQPISTEELLRRQKIFVKYLSENYEDNSHWVDVHYKEFGTRKTEEPENIVLTESYSIHDNTYSKVDYTKHEISNALHLGTTTKKQISPEVPEQSLMDDNQYQDSIRPNNDADNASIIEYDDNNKITSIVDNVSKISSDEKETILTNTEFISKQSSDWNEISNDHVDIKDQFTESERQKILKSYISKYSKTQENWIETYNFILNPNSEPVNSKSIPVLKSIDLSYGKNVECEYIVKKAESKSLDCVREKLFLRRLLKKLVSKFGNTEVVSITLSFNSESINQLKSLAFSEKLDITTADEVVNNLIFNAQINKDYNWAQYIPSYAFIAYAFSVIVSIYVVYSIRHNLCLLTMFFLFLIILSAVIMNYFKMYQVKLAEKQHIFLSISSDHCKNSLTPDSGIFDHFKEYFRYMYHNEHCKKYYHSLNVDSTYELNIIMVITDMVLNCLFHVFHVFADTLNYCVKAAFYDTVLYQKVIILALLMFSLLLLFSYKMKVSFITLEPSIPVGSRVEDLIYPRNRLIDFIRQFFRTSRTFPLSDQHDVNGTSNTSSTLSQIYDKSSPLHVQEISQESSIQIRNYMDKQRSDQLNMAKNINSVSEQEFLQGIESNINNSETEQACKQLNNSKNINSKVELFSKDFKILNSDTEVTDLDWHYATGESSVIEQTVDTKAVSSVTVPEKIQDTHLPNVKTGNTIFSSGVNKSHVEHKYDVNLDTVKRKLEMLVNLAEEALFTESSSDDTE